MITVCAITCPKCKATIFSRAHYDYRTCPCGLIFIDGGLEYARIGYNSDIISPKIFRLVIKQTRKELYDDWNYHRDVYGVIQEEISVEKILPSDETLSN